MELTKYNFTKATMSNFIVVLLYIVYIKASLKKLNVYDPHMILLIFYMGIFIEKGFLVNNSFKINQFHCLKYNSGIGIINNFSENH